MIHLVFVCLFCHIYLWLSEVYNCRFKFWLYYILEPCVIENGSDTGLVRVLNSGLSPVLLGILSKDYNTKRMPSLSSERFKIHKHHWRDVSEKYIVKNGNIWNFSVFYKTILSWVMASHFQGQDTITIQLRFSMVCWCKFTLGMLRQCVWKLSK